MHELLCIYGRGSIYFSKNLIVRLSLSKHPPPSSNLYFELNCSQAPQLYLKIPRNIRQNLVMAPVHWLFDVTSLMILVGDAKESTFRSTRNTYLEVLVAAPVAGIQSYLKDYEALPDVNAIYYYSPYGGKSAPLRNMKLEHCIKHFRLLENGKYTVYKTRPQAEQRDWFRNRYGLILSLWLVFTWVSFGGIIAFWRLAPFGVLPKGTWIGIANIVTLSGWSIFVRFIEFVMISVHEKIEKDRSQERHPEEPDGVIFFGKRASGLVIDGKRADIKYWTTVNRLDYSDGATFDFPNRLIQGQIKFGTSLVLVLVLLTLPNGSTTDQIAFILLNLLGQLNVRLGLRINAELCSKELQGEASTAEAPTAEAPIAEAPPATVKNRTQVYGYVIRHFNKPGLNSAWIDKVGILPQTETWDKWKKEILLPENTSTDPKELYDKLKEKTEPRNGTLPVSYPSRTRLLK
jgi:hypothetical protein